MLDTITNLYMQFSSASKDNPVLAGVVSLWGLSVVTYVFRFLPFKIIQFLYKQSTTSLSFNNAGDESNLIVFNSFNEWFIKRSGAKYSRSISMSKLSWCDRPHEQNGRIGAGYGYHFFTFNGRLFWFDKYTMESNATSIVKEGIKLTTIGRSHEIFTDLILAFLPVKKKNQMSLHSFAGKDWDFISYSKKRDINTVITHGNVKEKIIETLEEFFASKEWYDTRGFNYKQTFMLYGPPGTGKTSLIKAVATYFNRDIYSLNLAGMSSTSFEIAIRRLPKGAICLIEDFDDTSAVKTREGLHTNVKSDNVYSDEPVLEVEETIKETNRSMDLFSSLNLSTILNTLDGVGELDDIVIFLTTNCIESIDPALLRKGRIDHKLYIGQLQDEDIRRYCCMVFPELEHLPDRQFKDINGCDLAALFKEHKHNSEDFIKAIP